MRILRSTMAAVALALLPTQRVAGQDLWVQADQETVRLAPSAFPKLPPVVLQALESRKCVIPQSNSDAAPHNVIRGSFARQGQIDWAVLCSRARASTILVVWGGEAACNEEMEVREDRSYLQRVAGGKVVFTRRIETITRDGIQRLYERYGGPVPPISNRQGIEDFTGGQGSVVRLCHDGRWMELTGKQ